MKLYLVALLWIPWIYLLLKLDWALLAYLNWSLIFIASSFLPHQMRLALMNLPLILRHLGFFSIPSAIQLLSGRMKVFVCPISHGVISDHNVPQWRSPAESWSMHSEVSFNWLFLPDHENFRGLRSSLSQQFNNLTKVTQKIWTWASDVTHSLYLNMLQLLLSVTLWWCWFCFRICYK